MKTMVLDKQFLLKLTMILAVLLLCLFGTHRVKAAELSDMEEEATYVVGMTDSSLDVVIDADDAEEEESDIDIDVDTDMDVDEEEIDTDTDMDADGEEIDADIDMDADEEEIDVDTDMDADEEEIDVDTDMDVNEEETDADIDIDEEESEIDMEEDEFLIGKDEILVDEAGSEMAVSAVTEEVGTLSANASEGMVNKNGYQYYYYEAGKFYKNQFFTVNGKKYYADASGHIRNGVFTYNNDYYCADAAGVVITDPGWVTSGGKKYFVSPDGTLYCNRMLVINRRLRYYFGSNATVATGVQKTKVGYIYADSKDDGRVEFDKGWVNQNGKKYYTNGEGYLYTNHLITISQNERYYAGSQAELAAGVFKIGNNYIYADPNNDKKVQINAGWITWNGKKYFCDGNGYLYHDQFITFGPNTRYYMGSDATIKTGTFKVGDRFWYGDPQNGGKVSAGIDVSYFNGTIDWAKVAADGITFAFMRAGGRYGSTGEIYYDDHSGKNNNTVFMTNMKNAVANGIQVGAYFFTQAINEKEAIEEAQWLCKQVKASGVKVTLPLVIDTETVSSSNPGRHNSISVTARTNVIKAFCEEIKKKGYTPAIYASKSWLEDKLDMSKLSYPVWVARYNSYLGYSGDYICWQYSSTGRVNGINSSVDMNVWHN